MAFVLADRVKETTNTIGVGTLALAGAETDFQGFVDGIGGGNTCFYVILLVGGDEWEVGIGTVADAATDTLSRDEVLSSSNGGALVNFSAGAKDVFVVHPAGRVIFDNANNDVVIGGKLVLTPSPIRNITAAGGITVTHSHMRVQGSGGVVDVTADPQIAVGTDGQRVIIVGESSANTVRLDDGDGLHLHGGSVILGLHNNITLFYDAIESLWEEVDRNAPFSEKAWAFMSRDAGSGTNYIGGFYILQNGTSDFIVPQTLGTALASYAAHAFLVAGASPGSDSVIRVSGTSITDQGVRTPGDTEDLSFPSTASISDYRETPKKWLGEVAFTFISGDNTVVYNRGFCKYWDNNNTNFQVVGFEATWLGAQNDDNPDIKLRYHRATGWIFNLGSTPTPPPELASMVADHGTEIQIKTAQEGAWKRDNLSQNMSGGNGEGTIIELVTTTNRTYAIGNFMLRVRPR